MTTRTIAVITLVANSAGMLLTWGHRLPVVTFAAEVPAWMYRELGVLGVWGARTLLLLPVAIAAVLGVQAVREPPRGWPQALLVGGTLLLALAYAITAYLVGRRP